MLYLQKFHDGIERSAEGGAVSQNTATGSPPLLVGRERERAVLRQCLGAAIAGQGGLVLVGGEAGIGKTTLAKALCREAEESGALVLAGQCYELSETPPYGPWAELFGNHRPAADEPSPPNAFVQRGIVGAIDSQEALLAQVREYLALLSARHPVVVVLDDLHWADPGSIELLHMVVRGLDSSPLLVIATYRSDEVTKEHYLSRIMPAMIREATVTRLRVSPIGARDVEDLLNSRFALPDRDTRRLVTYLQERGEGNPFFIGELLHTLEEEGSLRRDADGWALDEIGDVHIPPLVRQVVGTRLARLGDDAQALLSVGALLGQAVPLALWAAVGDVPEDALLAVVEQAIAVHALAEMTDARQVRFVHALIRETVADSIPLARRRSLHRRIGEILAGRSAPDPDAVAYHFRLAGDPRAVVWLMCAGERAQRAYAWRTAAERFEAVVALLDTQGADAAERAWLHLRIWSLNRYSDPRRGVAHIEEATRLAAEASDPFLAACVLREHGKLRIFLGDLREGIRELERGHAALDALPDPASSNEQAKYAMHRGRGPLVTWLAEVGRFAEAAALAAHLTETESDGDALHGAGIIHGAMGRAREAHAAFDQARERFRGTENLYRMGAAAVERLCGVIVPYEADHPHKRRSVATETEALWTQVFLMLAEGAPRSARLPVLFVDGAWDEAWQVAQPILAEGRAIRAWRRHLVRDIVLLAHARGEDGVIGLLLDTWLPASYATAPGDAHFVIALALQRVASARALDACDFSMARAWLEAYDRWMEWSAAVLGRADRLLGWAAYHRATGDASLAHEWAARALADATALRQPLVLIAAHRLLGELESDAGRHAAAAAHLDAALTLADTCAAPYERALTLLAMAGLNVAAGNPARGRTLLEESCSICASLGAAPTLARARVLLARLGDHASMQPVYPNNLSVREVDVLRLIARGMSNRAIAESLFISSRTVNRHIENLYRKIGARNKADATAFAIHHNVS
jgi:DNA-binding CsgD family transcriptional regulator